MNAGKPCAVCWHLKVEHMNATGSKAETCHVAGGCTAHCQAYVDPDPDNRTYRGKRPAATR